MPTMLRTCILIILAMTVSKSFAEPVITPPPQPASGPGGSDYAYTGVKTETRGMGIHKYIIYEPNPRAAKALPVIAFMHGYNPFPNPRNNVDFVNHLVKKGHIVIWPYYMTLITLPGNFDKNAGNAIRSALDYIIANPADHARPEYDSRGKMNFALMGHSAGGITAANLAATYGTYGLPAPKAMICIAPGRGSGLSVPIRNYRRIPGNIYMLIIVDSEDHIGSDHGKYIWENSPQIPNSRKNWILVNSDYHGSPDRNDLVADHYDTLGSPHFPTNAHDWYGYWKWATALCNYAFYGTDGKYALGNTGAQRYMGVWSDGRAVIEPEVYDHVVWP
jgi:pimeloyl-ACP methyl ester carboxylesterase